MAEIRAGSFELTGADPADPSVGWLLTAGTVTFHADLRMKDNRFVDAVQRGEVRLSRGDVLLVDYRHKKRYGIRRSQENGACAHHGHSREGAQARQREGLDTHKGNGQRRRN